MRTRCRRPIDRAATEELVDEVVLPVFLADRIPQGTVLASSRGPVATDSSRQGPRAGGGRPDDGCALVLLCGATVAQAGRFIRRGIAKFAAFQPRLEPALTYGSHGGMRPSFRGPHDKAALEELVGTAVGQSCAFAASRVPEETSLKTRSPHAKWMDPVVRWAPVAAEKLIAPRSKSCLEPPLRRPLTVSVVG